MKDLKWNTSGEFYEAHFNQVFSFMKAKTPTRDIAMDLTQDVFLKVFRNWSQLETANSPKAYLFIIARNVLVDYYREKAENDASMFIALEEISETGSLFDSSEFDQEKIAELHRAIEKLPDQRREIIKLNKIEGLSTEEVANHLSLSKRTVENQIYRAMKTLKKHLVAFILLFITHF